VISTEVKIVVDKARTMEMESKWLGLGGIREVFVKLIVEL